MYIPYLSAIIPYQMATRSNITMSGLLKKRSLQTAPLQLTPEWNARENTCIRGKQTCFALDADGANGSCLIKTNDNSFFYMDCHGNVGINTTQPTAQMHILSENGACLRMTHSGSNVECDLFLDSNGNLTIDPDGSGVTITKSLNIVSHIGGVSGLYLRGALVTSTAAQLNYTNTTQGVAEPSKALVTDAEKNIRDLNSLTLLTPLAETSGGTGHATYTPGDLLMATSDTELTRLPISPNNGDMLVVDNSKSTKASWSPGLMYNYVDMGYPSWVSANTYRVPYLYAKNLSATNDLIRSTSADVGPQNILTSQALVGKVSQGATTSTIAGTGTSFTTDFIVGDVISVVISASSTISRRIVTITSNTSMIVDAAFTASKTTQYSYYRGGKYGLLRLYAFNSPSGVVYGLSNRSDNPIDLPTNCFLSDYRPLNFFTTYSGSTETITRMVAPKQFCYTPAFSIVSGASNTSSTTYSLVDVIPSNTCYINLLLTHRRTSLLVGGNIIIGDSNNVLQTLAPLNATGIGQITVGVPIIAGNLTFKAYVSASGSTYDISLLDYYVS